MSADPDTKIKMDRMYKWTRHVYDASRKYYLLGRDRMIANLNAQDGEHICEVGCGTARNLIKMAKAYPKAHFCGLDVSDEMLKTANENIRKAGLDIDLRQGYAQNFDPQDTFKLSGTLDKIVFSYALSIIPPWKESIDHALKILPSKAEMHIVDFGAMDEQPAWFRKLLFWWLQLFDVYHKPEILAHLKALSAEGKGTLEITQLYKGYAYIAVFKKA
ncbi:MAG: class I SAM-dependent methyltransferase [Pseudomonadota bacterium]